MYDADAHHDHADDPTDLDLEAMAAADAAWRAARQAEREAEAFEAELGSTVFG